MAFTAGELVDAHRRFLKGSDVHVALQGTTLEFTELNCTGDVSMSTLAMWRCVLRGVGTHMM